MQINHHLSIDLARQLPMMPIGAVQGDANTRAVEISLLENGAAWEVPAGITAAVAFRKPDMTKGLYDTLPDGTKAVTISGSTVTAILAPQVLSCAGEVSAAVVFHDSNLNQLATFPFTIRVKANPAAGKQVSNDYYQYSTMEEVSEAVEAAFAALEDSKQDFLAKAEEALQVVHDTAAENAPAVICEAFGESITVSDAAGRPLKGLSIYGKTVQNGTPTPSSPVPLESAGASGAINTTVCGKNLLNYDAVASFTSGISATVDENGYITLTNTTSAPAYPQQTIRGYKGTLYTTVEVTSSSGSADFYGDTVMSEYKRIIAGVGTKTVSNEVNGLFRFMLAIQAGASVTFRAIISADDNTEYEPYKEPQTLTASTPNGLPGIPVESGGNYTDENGQAWICDEVDFARSVYVHRVLKMVLDGTEPEWKAKNDLFFALDTRATRPNGCGGIYPQNINAMASVGMIDYLVIDEGGYGFTYAYYPRIRFEYLNPSNSAVDDLRAYLAENPITLVVPYDTPIETPLSAEELAQYAALHSNYPNTTVFNDSGAGMKLNYVADTKTYIDNKFAAISAAMLNA